MPPPLGARAPLLLFLLCVPSACFVGAARVGAPRAVAAAPAARSFSASACSDAGCELRETGGAVGVTEVAVARYVASEGKIGWNQFDVSTVSGAASAGVQAFAAGFLEGTLTADVIAQTARNTVAYFASSGVAGAEFPSANVTAFLLD